MHIDEPTTPAKSNRRTLLLILAIVVAVIGAVLAVVLVVDRTGNSAESAPASEPSTFTLIGTLVLQDEVVATTKGCAGDRGYDDIQVGASVTVYDPSGDVIAVGKVNKATQKDVSRIGNYSFIGSCELAFSATNVPAEHPIYSVEVSHRGKVAVSADDAKNGRVELTLG